MSKLFENKNEAKSSQNYEWLPQLPDLSSIKKLCDEIEKFV